MSREAKIRGGWAGQLIGVERTHDNVLWNVYDLKPGEHTVRFVTTGDADSRSKTKRIGISGAVVYRKR